MKKIIGNNDLVIVSLSPTEFKKLARKPRTEVADGTEVDLTWLLNLINFGDDNQSGLKDLKDTADLLSTKIGSLINV